MAPVSQFFHNSTLTLVNNHLHLADHVTELRYFGKLTSVCDGRHHDDVTRQSLGAWVCSALVVVAVGDCRLGSGADIVIGGIASCYCW